MIQRYSRPEMRQIWTDENKLKIWLQIELLATEALVAEGIVPKKDFASMKAGADKCFADTKALTERAKELEKTLNHDVIGFTTAVGDQRSTHVRKRRQHPPAAGCISASPAATSSTPRSPCR